MSFNLINRVINFLARTRRLFRKYGTFAVFVDISMRFFGFRQNFLRFFGFCRNFERFFGSWDPPDTPPPINEFPFTRAILWTRSVYSRIELEIEIVLDYKIVHPSFIYILWQKTNTQSAKYWFPVWKTGTKKYTYIITPYEFISFYNRRTSFTISYTNSYVCVPNIIS